MFLGVSEFGQFCVRRISERFFFWQNAILSMRRLNYFGRESVDA
jgi:hypothetical protein